MIKFVGEKSNASVYYDTETKEVLTQEEMDKINEGQHLLNLLGIKD